ncbi:hypothetical protein Bca52824_040989 [Brassica carinata]|uniref:Uncharacterized protein n=1 Tax=Brassica carinata TaxID=52824 RepID=A0A8X7RU23_BRACI|nr:hypothetical protein Bca52824_040989 [Brassica carinata]
MFPISSELRSPQRLNHNPRSPLKLQKLTVLNFSLNSNLLDGLIALVTGAGFWNSLSSVTSLNSPNLLCSSPESLNLLLVIAMVATTIFSSTTNFFQSKSSLTYVPSVPDHLICQLHTIHTAINHLTNHQQEKSISTASSLPPSPPLCRPRRIIGVEFSLVPQCRHLNKVGIIVCLQSLIHPIISLGIQQTVWMFKN